MAGHRQKPVPQRPQCIQCKREPRLLNRADNLGIKCAQVIDANARKAKDFAESKKAVAGK
jgi:glutaredoxin